MNVSRSIITIALALFISQQPILAANPSMAQTNEEVDYWETVKIDETILSERINQKVCSASVKYFFGCVEAIKAMANFSGKTFDLFPLESVTDKQPTLVVGNFKLVEVVREEIKTQKDLVMTIEKKRQDLKARFFSASLQFTKNPGTEFETLISQIKPMLPKSLTKSQIGLVLGKFLEVAIDPHTSLRPALELQSANQQSGVSFYGIGVQFTSVSDGLLVHSVIPKSGAEKAGMLAGDLITGINETTVKGLSTEQVVKIITGPENTKVKVHFIRKGKAHSVDVIRGKVESKVVTGQIFEDQSQKIGYLKITNFMYGKMCEESKLILQDFEKKKVNGIVMDLRGNPGGDVKNTQCLGGFFLGMGKVVSYFEEKGFLGTQYKALKSTTDLITKKPLVVLIDSGSASASEIMSGALQDYARALIVGQTSFGKGSYQGCGPVTYENDLFICQTGGLFHLPSGRTNQTLGVIPEVKAYLRYEASEAELYPLTEANLFLFPLESKVMPKAKPEAWPKMMVPQACLNAKKLPEKYQTAKPGQYFYNDYQLLTAASSVSCLGK